jgi:hypothetical protein
MKQEMAQMMEAMLTEMIANNKRMLAETLKKWTPIVKHGEKRSEQKRKPTEKERKLCERRE